MTEAELTQIADLWKRGLNTQQIANYMGIPEQAVYGTTLEIALKRARSVSDGVVVADNSEVTPEGYKAAMVVKLLALKDAPAVAAPGGKKAFLAWLDQP